MNKISKESYLECLEKMKEMENQTPFPRKLTEDRIKQLIRIYEEEIDFIIKVVDKVSISERKKMGYEKPRDIDERLSSCKMVVIVLQELLNIPPYKIKYSKEWGKYKFLEWRKEDYEKQIKTEKNEFELSK